jgi:glycerol-3-phosphate acyltransferase PlsY
VLLTGYSSLAAIITVTLAPVYTLLFKPDYIYPVIMLSVLIVWQHRDNIRRLLSGRESKIWKKGNVNE